MFVTFLEMKIIHLHDYNKLKHVKVMFLVKKKTCNILRFKNMIRETVVFFH